jgi:hypothetical protein
MIMANTPIKRERGQRGRQSRHKRREAWETPKPLDLRDRPQPAAPAVPKIIRHKTAVSEADHYAESQERGYLDSLMIERMQRRYL